MLSFTYTSTQSTVEWKCTYKALNDNSLVSKHAVEVDRLPGKTLNLVHQSDPCKPWSRSKSFVPSASLIDIELFARTAIADVDYYSRFHHSSFQSPIQQVILRSFPLEITSARTDNNTKHDIAQNAEVQEGQDVPPHAGHQEDARGQGAAIPEHQGHDPQVQVLLRARLRQHAQHPPQGREAPAVRLKVGLERRSFPPTHHKRQPDPIRSFVPASKSAHPAIVTVLLLPYRKAQTRPTT